MKSNIKSMKDLKHEALADVGVDMVRQTTALMLWSMHIDGKSDEEILHTFEVFVGLINTKEILGKTLKSNEISEFYANKIGIDLDRIQPRVKK